MRYVLTFLLLFTNILLHAQELTVPVDTVVKTPYSYRKARDSAFKARQKIVTDSIIAHTWIIPDSLLSSTMIMDSIMKAKVYSRPSGEPWYTIYNKKKKESLYKTGTPIAKGQVWVLAFVGVLLLLFAILKNSFSRQLQTIVQAFFSDRILNNLNKEDNLFTSWPFLLLFIQFGFTIGMFIYLTSQYYGIGYLDNGFRLLFSMSVIIIVLYAFKILLLRMLGYIFNIQKPVHEYISILYLSYFNISLLFIPLVVAFALSPLKYGIYYIAISVVVLAIIFAFQFIRAGVNILSHHRFSKVYLFLYFCALEICPILILIKVIGL
ncbi:DUF4271 domain-containing protein [Pedobacter sp. MC2016-14]|uniref:DUF4271 domain-containing protein n=1 Tax=Pedobacter sp. MC2016-14 TaxID=2897327 RepID=UPI001E5384D2|nr:DUF4271 domain-containing protein [Pedobacter sp. MC2016-14]MCD0487725.1 DUF4271 domain-containing protein [Pedobacter sp. MC2016-14]